jgi:hypothetical protein
VFISCKTRKAVLRFSWNSMFGISVFSDHFFVVMPLFLHFVTGSMDRNERDQMNGESASPLFFLLRKSRSAQPSSAFHLWVWLLTFFMAWPSTSIIVVNAPKTYFIKNKLPRLFSCFGVILHLHFRYFSISVDQIVILRWKLFPMFVMLCRSQLITTRFYTVFPFTSGSSRLNQSFEFY